MSSTPLHREAVPDLSNPLGLDGIEFIEYATSRPQALGQVLEAMASGLWPATVPVKSSCTAKAV